MALEKANIIVVSTNERIEVLFNPNEYVIETNNSFAWKKVPGFTNPIAQFISGEASILTMDLFFDTYEKRTDVRDHTSLVAKLMEVDKDLHAPPVCRFVWGSMDFKGVIEKINERYTMFLDSGIPVRAVLQVRFAKWESISEQLKRIPRQSSDRTKQKILQQGQQLWMLAGDEYEDPGLWREIARANGIDNPRVLESGQRLVVPPLD
ncbi:MAG: LysM peptidoglycan-binding domain-containing protein [Syntrophomonadaceae bacterium]|nr:LysM peptidoglycan-binding domain-containing protein [Syntrophomonadaceae bacterium]MDD3023757.1 LysM peptidoglycan-binding domain-containing protein [Syntrophomonadaceae bacterium]